MPENIVVAVDGSEASLKGLSIAEQLAKPTGAKLLLTCVIPPFGEGTELEGMLPPGVHQRAQQEAEQIVSSVASRTKGVEVEQLVLNGRPAETLADLAEKRKAWLVVVGSRGRGAVARALLGSVADRLVRICHQPVLVVH